MTLGYMYRKRALVDVELERIRQVKKEGRTPEGDDAYQHGELAMAAMAYTQSSLRMAAGPTSYTDDEAVFWWPPHWERAWFKRKTQRRDLVRAAALIVAEIERLDRIKVVA